MHRSLLASLALAFLLPGCAAQTVTAGLNPLRNHPIEEVYARIGYPDAETTLAGRRVMVWGNSSGGYLPLAQPSITTGNTFGGGFSSFSTSYAMLPFEAHCEIRVWVSDSGTMLAWDMNGNQIGCERYSQRF